jgi:hypothetical protein
MNGSAAAVLLGAMIVAGVLAWFVLIGMTAVCTISDAAYGYVTVWNSGLAMYGSDLCKSLRHR